MTCIDSLFNRSNINELIKGRAPELRHVPSHTSIESVNSVLSQLSALVEYVLPALEPHSAPDDDLQAHKRVSFSNKVSVYLIPSIRDQRREGYDLYWTIEELFRFREEARSEIQAAASLYSCDLVEAFKILYRPEDVEPTDPFPALVTVWSSFASKCTDRNSLLILSHPLSERLHVALMEAQIDPNTFWFHFWPSACFSCLFVFESVLPLLLAILSTLYIDFIILLFCAP